MKKLGQTLAKRWPEYLLEILVLVIGIYGAFKLDNWNEDRRARNKEKTLMVNLKRDFVLRQTELIELQIARSKALISVNELNKAMANIDNLPPKARLDTCIMNINNAMSFNDQFKMLDVIFSTGMINDLKNEDLKQQLLLWPQQVEEMMEEQRSRLEFNMLYMVPLLIEYVAIREIYELVTFRGYGTPKGTEVVYKTDYRGLLSSPEFERYLAQFESLCIVNEIDTRILLGNAEQIIALLDQEINK